MNDNIIKSIDTANKIEKHKTTLQLCEQYLSVLRYTPTEDMAYKANQYATGVYDDIKREEPEIAIENTYPFPRNVDIVTLAKDNLRAVIKMLKQILVKELKEESDNISDIIK